MMAEHDNMICVDPNGDEYITVDEAIHQVNTIREYCITQFREIAVISSFAKHVVLHPKHDMFKHVAFTDGYTVYYGEGFFIESLKAQAAILTHELLHMGLRHPQRGKKLFEAKHHPYGGVNYNPTIMNLSADCLVNLPIQHFVSNGKMEWPSCGHISIDRYLSSSMLQKWPPNKWDVESLYCHLMENNALHVLSMDADKGIDGLESIVRGATDASALFRDVTTLDISDVKADTEEEVRNWETRMDRALQGDSAGGALRNLSGDIPKSKTPWHLILRRWITAHVLPETELHDYRPSRGMMTRICLNKKRGIKSKIIFEPGVQLKTGIRRMAVIIDTSGSVDDAMLDNFLGQVQAIRAQTGSDIVLIFADASVHKIIELKSHDNLKSIVKSIMDKGEVLGGGGTNFIPAVEEVNEMPDIAIAVYLTDMMGTFPRSSRVPLIWAATGHTNTNPPCGRVIYLKD